MSCRNGCDSFAGAKSAMLVRIDLHIDLGAVMALGVSR